MIVHVDSNSAMPVFEQLRVQIQRMISSGQLEVGTKLPPIRQLASDLQLARGTVNKVYEALARDGLVKTAGRHGTVVLEAPKAITSTNDLAAAAETLALVASQLGLDSTAAHVALDDALANRTGPQQLN